MKKKKKIPLSSSNTLSHYLSNPFKLLKPWLDPICNSQLFMPSLPPILVTSADKAQSSITSAALGLSLSLSNSQSHLRHFHHLSHSLPLTPKPAPSTHSSLPPIPFTSTRALFFVFVHLLSHSFPLTPKPSPSILISMTYF